MCPLNAAKRIGIIPSSSKRFSILEAKNLKISVWPVYAAKWIGVISSSLGGLESSKKFATNLTISVWPAYAAKWIAVIPLRFVHPAR